MGEVFVRVARRKLKFPGRLTQDGAWVATETDDLPRRRPLFNEKNLHAHDRPDDRHGRYPASVTGF